MCAREEKTLKTLGTTAQAANPQRVALSKCFFLHRGLCGKTLFALDVNSMLPGSGFGKRRLHRLRSGGHFLPHAPDKDYEPVARK
jgi:hypothetical protein